MCQEGGRKKNRGGGGAGTRLGRASETSEDNGFTLCETGSQRKLSRIGVHILC